MHHAPLARAALVISLSAAAAGVLLAAAYGGLGTLLLLRYGAISTSSPDALTWDPLYRAQSLLLSVLLVPAVAGLAGVVVASLALRHGEAAPYAHPALWLGAAVPLLELGVGHLTLLPGLVGGQ